MKRIKTSFAWVGRLFFKVLKIIFSFWLIGGFLAIILMLGYSKVIIYVADIKNNTVPLTNIGFAVIAAISSICFSWARAIDQSEKNTVAYIIVSGELALVSALLFLSASALKFTYFESLKGKMSQGKTTYGVICQYGSIITFTLAFILIIFVLTCIGMVLNKRKFISLPPTI